MLSTHIYYYEEDLFNGQVLSKDASNKNLVSNSSGFWEN